MANYFKVLSETIRLQVLYCVKSGSKNVTEIIAATDLGQEKPDSTLGELQARLQEKTELLISISTVDRIVACILT